VAPGGGDLQGPPRERLPPDVGEIGVRSPPRGRLRGRGGGGGGSSSAARIARASCSVAAGWTGSPGAIVASRWLSFGTMAATRPCRRARSSVGRTPATDRRAPSRASSPTSSTAPRWGRENPPSAARRPTAVARSNEEPYFRRPAGARLTVIRRSHLKGMPQLRSAARIRASLSFTAESASPTIVKRGKPGAESASTRTRWASTPRTAAVSDVASMAPSLEDGGRGPFEPQPTRGKGRARSDARPARCPTRASRGSSWPISFPRAPPAPASPLEPCQESPLERRWSFLSPVPCRCGS
jgi:hypothetical protein